MKTAIVIPARYGSKRLPGKPLRMIAGKTLLQRAIEIAKHVQNIFDDVSVLVATDDERILEHAKQLNIPSVMTPKDCATGTDRVLAAVNQLPEKPDFIVNLQGDIPLMPPDCITALLKAYQKDNTTQVATIATQLSWQALDTLRDNKKTTPFSGTCVTINPTTQNAFWFSKNIIPAMRDEKILRQTKKLSPIYRHIGLYAYTLDALKHYVNFPKADYEALEGLEQLRWLENDYAIRVVSVDYPDHLPLSGVDTEADIARTEKLIAEYGELLP